MDLQDSITFVIAVNNDDIYRSNFLASPLFHADHCHQILPQRNFRSASQAYNAGMNQAQNDLIVFAHQDIFFPEGWIAELQHALKYLAIKDPSWGVLGSFGSKKNRPGGVGLVYTTGMGIHGNKIDSPEQVETLDEIVLVLRKSSGLQFA